MFSFDFSQQSVRRVKVAIVTFADRGNGLKQYEGYVDIGVARK